MVIDSPPETEVKSYLFRGGFFHLNCRALGLVGGGGGVGVGWGGGGGQRTDEEA
jgi:hypothetical protein